MCVPCRIGDKSNRAVLFSLGRPRRRNRRLLRFFLSVTVTWQLWHYLWHDFTILICFALPLHKYTTTAHRWLTGTVYNWQFTGAQQSTALCHLETRLSITFTFFAHCPSADSGWISAVHYKALLLQVTLVNRLLDGWPTEGWLRILIVVARAINHPGGWPIGCCVDGQGNWNAIVISSKEWIYSVHYYHWKSQMELFWRQRMEQLPYFQKGIWFALCRVMDGNSIEWREILGLIKIL